MMRIITGSARGARLVAPEGVHTRPTAERTKEAVFSMLQYEFQGRRCLDLFGGSGQLGLEALSRGAAETVIVDNDKGALAAIEKNAAHTRLAPRARIVKSEATAFLRSYRGEPFHLVFLDPPYLSGVIPACLSLLLERNLLADGALLVCETGTPEAVLAGDPALEACFTVRRVARYGAAHVTVLEWRKREKRLALVPGSFDPITEGHLDIITRAAERYGEVVVAVMNNDAKTYLFQMAERGEMAELATAKMQGVRVVCDSGLLVDLFDRLGADVIVKGVRNETDRAYELEMAAYNKERNPRAETVLLEANPDKAHLSSTLVRKFLAEGKLPEAGLPTAVAAYLKGRGYSPQKEDF